MFKTITLNENFSPGTNEDVVQARQQSWLRNTLVISSDYNGSKEEGWVLTTVMRVTRSVMSSLSRHQAI